MTSMNPTTVTGAANGLSKLASVFSELPKTQAVGIAMVITAGAIIAIDIATSRGYNVAFDWPNKTFAFTKASAS